MGGKYDGRWRTAVVVGVRHRPQPNMGDSRRRTAAAAVHRSPSVVYSRRMLLQTLTVAVGWRQSPTDLPTVGDVHRCTAYIGNLRRLCVSSSGGGQWRVAYIEHIPTDCLLVLDP